LAKVRKQVGVPILTDVHTEEQATEAGQVVDVLQIPAFLCRQTDLLIAAANTGRVVNVKKGQFLSPLEMANAVKKVEECGNRRIVLTERGSSFGYNNLVVDMRSFPILRGFGYPVVFDATHSVQLPGGGGTKSSGQREFVEPLACAAAGAGVDGFFMEVHPNPDEALSDGPNMVPLHQLKTLLERGVGDRSPRCAGSHRSLGRAIQQGCRSAVSVQRQGGRIRDGKVWVGGTKDCGDDGQHRHAGIFSPSGGRHSW
jgi:2-dehydro-3-deoxyphosphooctonate aldolase (KDO 8-P synthase)